MTAINNSVIWGIVALVLCGCGRDLPPQAYMDYFGKNKDKFCKVVTRNGVTAKIAFVPSEYFVARDLNAGVSTSLDSLSSRYGKSLFFVFSLGDSSNRSNSILLERGGVQGFRESVFRNTFERGQDIFLLRGTDTVKVAACNFDRNWGLSNDDSFLIAFAKSDLRSKPEAYHLIIREMVPELGTVDLSLGDIVKKTRTLKG
jgi:hypothetical protein